MLKTTQSTSTPDEPKKPKTPHLIEKKHPLSTCERVGKEFKANKKEIS
jgi:hypothetical protein